MKNPKACCEFLSQHPYQAISRRALQGLICWAAGSVWGVHAAAPAVPPVAWTQAQQQAAGVQTQILTRQSAAAAQDMVLQGTVVLPPQAVQVVSATVSGVLQDVRVAPGQSLKAGQVVARLSSPQVLEWQREWLQAQAQAQLAGSKRQRDEKLFAEGIIAEQRVQESRSQDQMAQWTLQERTQALRLAGADTRHVQLQPELLLPTPTAGTVLEVLASPGQRLEAGMPVLKLARGGLWSIELQATPEQARLLRVGDRLALPGCQTQARVVNVAAQVSADNQAVAVRADFNAQEACLRVNQFIQVRVKGGAAGGPASGGAAGGTGKDSLWVPTTAVVQQAGQTHVFVRTPQGFVLQPVTLGAGSAEQRPVLGGLAAGAEVVVKGMAALKGAVQGLGTDSGKGAP